MKIGALRKIIKLRWAFVVLSLALVGTILTVNFAGRDAPVGSDVRGNRGDSLSPSAVEGDSDQSLSPSPAVGRDDSLPSFPPVTCRRGSTRLSFISTRDGSEEIYALDIRRPDDVRRITRLPGIVQDQTWSPDGRRFAYRWFHPATQSLGVYVANADGSNPKLLVDNGTTPAWSPDGRLIAYTMNYAIWVVDVNNALKGDLSTAHLLVRPHGELGQAEYPVWSPDGNRLLFNGLHNGSFDIWTVEADGSGLRDLTPQPSLEYSATWSPDGSEIVFGSNRASESQLGGDIFAVDVETRKIRRLTAEQGGNYAPAWSPDGRWIAFNSNRDGNTEIYIMRPNGTGQRRLTTAPQDDIFAVWVGDCRDRPK
jgi:TolB protein